MWDHISSIHHLLLHEVADGHPEVLQVLLVLLVDHPPAGDHLAVLVGSSSFSFHHFRFIRAGNNLIRGLLIPVKQGIVGFQCREDVWRYGMKNIHLYRVTRQQGRPRLKGANDAF